MIGATAIVNFFYNNHNNHNNHKPLSYTQIFIFLSTALCSIYYLTYANLKNETDLLKSRLTIMSDSMSTLKHYRIDSESMENDVNYLKIIDTEKKWLLASENFFDDIYTMRRGSDKSIAFVVDSETDYDRNGQFDTVRESRTKIGEIYDKELVALTQAFDEQKFTYTENIYTDKWGTWISAFYPLYDLDNKFDGIIGADIAVEKVIGRFIFYNFLVALGFMAIYLAILFVIKNQNSNLLLNINLKNNLKESEENLKYQQQFLAVMSHEIRTPLNAIIGSIQLIDVSMLSIDDQDNLLNAKQSSHLLAEIIGDVLDYSKIQSNKIILDKTEVNLESTFHSIKHLFGQQMKSKGLQFEIEIQPELKNSYFGIDDVRLRQILMNFISNSYKFTNAGCIKVYVSAVKTENFLTVLEFRISDTGIGISLDDQKKLFQAFQQADSTITRKFGGTGLGLVIAKNLIEQMGGQIHFDSQQNKGTTIVFTIVADNISQKMSDTLATQNAQKFIFKTYSELKILVADDVLINQIVLQKTLNKIGFHADLVSTGLAAIEKHESENYDIIFMDCQMPEMDGLEATKLIRIAENNKQQKNKVSIIALTANASSAAKKSCLAAGMDQFLSKPFSLSQIENVLQFAIQQTENNVIVAGEQLSLRNKKAS